MTLGVKEVLQSPKNSLSIGREKIKKIKFEVINFSVCLSCDGARMINLKPKTRDYTECSKIPLYKLLGLVEGTELIIF